MSYDPRRDAPPLAPHRRDRDDRPRGRPPRARRQSGQGCYGETNDKVVTNFGFILIVFFPLFIFVASLIHWRTDKRKDEKLEAAKARATSSEWKGGW